MKGLMILIVIIVLILIGVFMFNGDENASDSGDAMEKDKDIMMEKEDEVMSDSIINNYSAVLEDVSGGNASGTVGVSYDGNKYTLVANFSNLPDLENDFFYEGWVVRKGSNFEALSTGKIEFNGDRAVNNFESSRDLTDHSQYVLTLEPDDGDPAPADHIVEGDFKKL